MRVFLGAIFGLQILLGNVLMAQMMPVQELFSPPVLQASSVVHEECAKHRETPRPPDFSCLDHCLSQASDGTKSSFPLLASQLVAAALPSSLPALNSPTESSGVIEVIHPSLSPPPINTVVLLQ